MKREDLPEDALIADGFDDAICGITTNGIVCYEYAKCIEILMNNHDMDIEMAIEYFDFNVGDAYVGENTPIFIHL
jgi:hypothetical protein